MKRTILTSSCCLLFLVTSVMAAGQKDLKDQPLSDQSTIIQQNGATNQMDRSQDKLRSDQGVIQKDGSMDKPLDADHSKKHFKSDSDLKDDSSPGYMNRSKSEFRSEKSIWRDGATDEMQDQMTDEPQQRKIGSLTVTRLNSLTGIRGNINNQGFYVVRFSPLVSKVTVAGIQFPPSLVPNSTVFIRSTGTNQAKVEGDFVLLQSQINPVIDTVLDNNLKVVALHNPFLWDEPRTSVLHVSGTGNPEQVARTIGKIVSWVRQGNYAPMSPGMRDMSENPEMREGATFKRNTGNGAYQSEDASHKRGAFYKSDGGLCPPETGVCAPVNKCPDANGGICPCPDASTNGGVCPSEGAAYQSDASKTSQFFYKGGQQCAAIYEDGGMDLSRCGINPAETSLDMSNLRNIFGISGREYRGIYRFDFVKRPTAGGLKEAWLHERSTVNFAGSDDKAVATGHLQVPDNNLQNALKALRDAKIDILSIAGAAAIDTPAKHVSVTFLGIGKAEDLAHGINNALLGNTSPRMGRTPDEEPTTYREGETFRGETETYKGDMYTDQPQKPHRDKIYIGEKEYKSYKSETYKEPTDQTSREEINE